MIGRVTHNFQMTFRTGQNPHGGEKSLSTFERHQISASSMSLFIFSAFFWVQFDAGVVNHHTDLGSV